MNQPDQDQRDLLSAVQDDWLRLGASTAPADRKKAELGSWEAYESIGEEVMPTLLIWVQSPLAGVLASTYVGFALGEQLKPRLMTPLEEALKPNVAAAHEIRRAIDQAVWHGLRDAVHRQVAADLSTRGPEFERMKDDIGNYTWDQVWQEVGDPIYDHMFGKQAQASDGLFEENLQPWADSMMEGQFGAGMMAHLDALDVLGHADPEPFTGIRRVARSCCWWWAYDAGVIFCERPSRVEVSDKHVTMEFRDGWTVQT